MTTPEPKTVKTDMAQRRVFATPELAAAYLTTLATTISDFGSFPFAAPGVDSEGNFDPAIYTADTQTMVAKLNNKGGGVKAIVVAPIPTVAAIMAAADGPAWIEKIIHKQLNHVAVAALREAADVSTVIDQMPTTLESYISNARDGSGIMEAFDSLYKAIIKTLAAKVPTFAKARLNKSELKKCMESRGYALEFNSALEDRPLTKDGKDGSLFVAAINLGISSAKRKGLDPTIFERWLDTRNAKTYTPGEDEDEDELDLDSLTDELMADDAPAPAAAPDAAGDLNTDPA